MEALSSLPAPDQPPPRRNRHFAAWWYAANALLLVASVFVPVWIKANLHLFANYDLGIFAQALARITPTDLNPAIPALGIPLFNDHFDPILIVFAPLARIMEPAFAALVTEQALILLSPLPFFLLCRKNPDQAPFLCFAATFLLFNRGVLSALGFPVHPTTWAAFFTAACAALVVTRRHFPLLVLSSLLLMACKEEFPFLVLMLGFGYLFEKRRRQGALLITLSLAWLAVAFGIRPWLNDGRTNNYAGRILLPLLSDPVAAIRACFVHLVDAKRLFQCLFPLIPAGLWLARKRIAPNWLILIAMLPLLGIRVIDGAWKFHYLAPIAPLLLAFVWRPDKPAPPLRYALTGCLIVLLAGANPIGKSLSAYRLAPDLGGERRAALEKARLLLLSEKDGDALVHGNLTPLLARREGVFQIGGVQETRKYRFFLAEKPPCGDPWPLSHADIRQAISLWRKNPNVTVLQDDAHLFLAESVDPAR